MSEMIDRVAKAIYEAMDLSDGLDGTAAKTYARAAIEAMREPSEAMCTAGDECCGEYGCGVWRMREIFTAQIDAALKD